MDLSIVDKITLFADYFEAEDIIICTAGKQFKSVKQDGPYKPPFNVLHYVVNGEGTFIVNNKTYKLTKGDIFFLPENEVVTYYGNKNFPYTYYWLSFKGKYADYLLKKANITINNPVLHVDDKKILKLFSSAFKQIRNNTLSSNILATAYLLEIMSFFIENNTSPTENMNYLLSKALDYIYRNIYKPLSINDISSFLNCDRSYFSKLFTKQLGVSPKEFVLNLKLSHCKTLLTQTDKSITQIAHECGMNLTELSYIFKKKFSVSPLCYRKENKKMPTQLMI